MAEPKKMTNCDMCANYEFNEETGFYECNIALDEDEMVQFLSGSFRNCPYFSLEGANKIEKKTPNKSCAFAGVFSVKGR